MTDYPDDEDGAVLADLEAYGVDMSEPLLIEFPIDAPDEKSAAAIQEAISKAGFQSEIEFDAGETDEDDEADLDDDEVEPSWTVYAKKEMIPNYDEIIRIQAELTRLAEPHGGNCDGWGVMLADD